MRFYIPEIGDTIKLVDDWQFDLYQEYRNQKLFIALGITNIPQGWQHWYGSRVNRSVTLEAGTHLCIDRIYVRKGKSEYSSVTFKIVKHPTNKALNKKRFWVKLDDANGIQFLKA